MILTFTFANAINLLLGILVGFLISSIVAVISFSHRIKKINKNKEIRTISSDTYERIFSQKDNLKDKVFLSLENEIKEVSTLVYPNSDYPLYELSFNEVIDGLEIIHDKLDNLICNPLFKYIKDVKISSIIMMKRAADPFIKIYKNKFVKVLSKIFKVLLMVVNVFNPVYYTRIIVQHYVKKRGAKEMTILCLDVIGNTCFSIYKDSNKKDL